MDLRWIPWKRYVLLISIDDGPLKALQRFVRRERLINKARDLHFLKGYSLRVVDTKERQILYDSDITFS